MVFLHKSMEYANFTENVVLSGWLNMEMSLFGILSAIMSDAGLGAMLLGTMLGSSIGYNDAEDWGMENAGRDGIASNAVNRYF